MTGTTEGRATPGGATVRSPNPGGAAVTEATPVILRARGLAVAGDER